MKLEQQVTSLELSKKLKALGVKQESLFWWSVYDGGNTKEKPGIIFTDDANHGFEEDLTSAFTVAELGDMLPDRDITSFNHKGTWYCEIASWINAKAEDGFEANARAKMLIYLLENNLITP